MEVNGDFSVNKIEKKNVDKNVQKIRKIVNKRVTNKALFWVLDEIDIKDNFYISIKVIVELTKVGNLIFSMIEITTNFRIKEKN